MLSAARRPALACAGVDSGIGGPFGAGIAKAPEMTAVIAVSIACTTVIRDNDPTAHAEMNAIRMASSSFTASFLITVFWLRRPSPADYLAAACWARIPRIYYSEDYDETRRAARDDSISQYIKGTNPEQLKKSGR